MPALRMSASADKADVPNPFPNRTDDGLAEELLSQQAGPIYLRAGSEVPEKELAQREGIFVGITAGATFEGALRTCENTGKNVTLLCMLPDTGERYLSTPLFADIRVDMTDE